MKQVEEIKSKEMKIKPTINTTVGKIVLSLMEQVGVVKKGLGGNASNVQAGASKASSHFHTGGLSVRLKADRCMFRKREDL